MSELYAEPEELQQTAKQYKKELLASTDKRIALQQYDLQKLKEWRTWCAKENSMFIYMNIGRDADGQNQAIREAERKELQRYEQIKWEISDPLPFRWIMGILFFLFIGAEWYASSSYGNFCYRLGHHFVSILFTGIAIGIVIWAGLRIKRFRVRE